MDRDFIHVETGVPGRPGSPWLASSVDEQPRAVGDLETDVLVVGGGLVGALTAYELSKRDVRVTIVERRRVASGTTGHSTAKITILHATRWDRLLRDRPPDAAMEEWAALNAGAPAAIAGIVHERGIDCSFRALDAFLCLAPRSRDGGLDRDFRAFHRLGMPVEDAGLVHGSPFGDVLALHAEGQAQFDPAAFTVGLIESLPKERVRLYESSPVRSLERERDGWKAVLDSGTVRAPVVVMATLAPVRDRALLFARMFPYAHYAFEALPVRSPGMDGMWIEANGARLTARPKDGPESEWILSGTTVRSGSLADERTAYTRLLRASEALFGGSAPFRHWYGEDFDTADGLPLIGRLGRHDGLYLAGGFAAWGMTKAVAAARIIAGQIAGQPRGDLDRMLAPGRFPPLAATSTLLAENAEVAKHYITPTPEQKSAAIAAPPLVQAGQEPPRCTHLYCLPKVDRGDGTIACPCHGSRFASDGSVLYGPAQRDLAFPASDRAATLRRAEPLEGPQPVERTSDRGEERREREPEPVGAGREPRREQ